MFVDVTCSMRTSHNWCLLTDALRPWLNSTDRCAQPIPENYLAMCTSYDWSEQSTRKVNVAIGTSHDRSGRSITTVTWSMSISVWWYFFPKSHRSWLMVLVVARSQCPPNDRHTPRLMHPPSVDASCRWPTSLTRCQHVMINACPTWSV